jgi:hypothetical protein
MVGLAGSETAQVNVLNQVGSATFVTGVFSTTVTPSCAGSVSFYDAKGKIIGSPETFTIGAGEIFSATLSPTSSIRTTIRAAVTINPADAKAPCSPSSNIETFDTATGVTHVHAESVPGVSLLGFGGFLSGRTEPSNSQR